MKTATGFASRIAEAEQFYLIVLILLVVPMASIVFAGYDQRPSFVLPFFPFQCIVGFLLFQWIYSQSTVKGRGKRVAPIAIGVLAGMIWCSGFCMYIFYATIGGHSPGVTEEKFLQKRIANFIVGDMKANRIKEASISYDLIGEMPIWSFITKFHSVDPKYHVGMEFDYFLEKCPDIYLPSPTPDGLRPDARYIIVFQQGARRYERSKYRKYDFEQFAVLIRRPSEL